MRVRTFQPQFARLVEAGTKRQTIRLQPKRPIQTGDMESWREWTGKPYRSKQRELAKVRITKVFEFSISHSGMFYFDHQPESLGTDAAMELAKADGFQNVCRMVEWFSENHGLPFNGILIKAENLE